MPCMVLKVEINFVVKILIFPDFQKRFGLEMKHRYDLSTQKHGESIDLDFYFSKHSKFLFYDQYEKSYISLNTLFTQVNTGPQRVKPFAQQR